ncbi:hypothetical protein ANCCEY_06605 [Ancylostoma ceylanicum]|uniref:non-specific serine/threonine protein kinase n=1 Tax=Ancylostoma ceylanicum TaxID=53326 RepID=A0A0D6LT12_9BILA|nr:hypothetical protein ANCCEY_06605 [Ancylostoma ceylanicum]
MQLLSVNIGDLKKASPVRRLGRSTVGRILQQAIAGLRDVHLGGYIHRDVKPANMCFGISPQQSGDPQTSFLALTCDSFQEFARAVLSLNTEEEPNYAALQALLTELVGDRKMSDPYDWETNYREAIEGVRIYPYGFQPKCRSRRRCHAVIEEAY